MSFANLIRTVTGRIAVMATIRGVGSGGNDEATNISGVGVSGCLRVPGSRLVLLVRSDFHGCHPGPTHHRCVRGDGNGGEPLNVPAMLSEVVRRYIHVVVRPVYRTEFCPRDCNFHPCQTRGRTVQNVVGIVGTKYGSPSRPI